MPADLVRVDLDALYPPFVERLLNVLAACRARGAEYFVISGYRSAKEQATLYFQGRTTPGPVVTNARPYQSAHNWGIAADLCRDGNVQRKGLQPDYDPASYDVLGEESKRAGLEWGGDYKLKDRPHVQWVAKVPTLSDPNESEYGRVRAFWRHLDSRS